MSRFPLSIQTFFEKVIFLLLVSESLAASQRLTVKMTNHSASEKLHSEQVRIRVTIQSELE